MGQILFSLLLLPILLIGVCAVSAAPDAGADVSVLAVDCHVAGADAPVSAVDPNMEGSMDHIPVIGDGYYSGDIITHIPVMGNYYCPLMPDVPYGPTLVPIGPYIVPGHDSPRSPQF